MGGSNPKRFHICAPIGDNFNHCYNTEFDIEYNQWCTLMIRQHERDMEIEDGIIHGVVHVYQIWIDRVMLYEVINTQSRFLNFSPILRLYDKNGISKYKIYT